MTSASEAVFGPTTTLELVRLRLACEDYAAQLVRRHAHDLGDALHVVRLASAELARRGSDPELAADLQDAAARAASVLDALSSVAHPSRIGRGAVVAPVLRSRGVDAAFDPALATRLPEDELEALCDALFDGPAAWLVRMRTIEGARWIELVRITEHSRPTHAIIDKLVARAGGELSSERGRDGFELAIALPVV